MARVSLIDPAEHPDLAELVGRIRSGRRGTLLNIYRLLLHSPPLAERWYDQVSAVRFQTHLDGAIRELTIIRVGVLNRVAYVVNQHAPTYAIEEGLTSEQVADIAEWRSSSRFDDRQRAVLAYVDSMTLEVQVPDAVFADVRKHFDERQTVELTVLIGTYNMHTRVLQALEIDPEPRPATSES